MKVVAAYLLAHLGGKASPAADDINAILSSGEFYIVPVLFKAGSVSGLRKKCKMGCDLG
jgi:ribosomal protein L12E/L44/L45/RPP1/RPP2